MQVIQKNINATLPEMDNKCKCYVSYNNNWIKDNDIGIIYVHTLLLYTRLKAVISRCEDVANDQKKNHLV